MTTTPALPLRTDPSSAVPVFEQVQVQVVDLITTGRLRAGDQLPSVRALADQLGVAPGTVAKAYRGLEQEGFLQTAGRAGTRVDDQHVAATAGTRAQLRAVLQPLLDDGMSSTDVIRLVRSVLTDGDPAAG